MNKRMHGASQGIVVLQRPQRHRQYKYMYEHLDCDSIVLDTRETDDEGNSIIQVVAYAIKESYNDEIKKMFEHMYRKNKGKYALLYGIDSTEANGIDLGWG